jgi:hypothetical protein
LQIMGRRVHSLGTLFATQFRRFAVIRRKLVRSTSMQSDSDRPVRAGVFNTARAAHGAVQALLSAGFSREQITVVCSDEEQEQEFRAFEHQQPAGTNTPAAVATGGGLGAAIGGVAAGAAAGAAGIATGGLPLLIAGGAGLMTGGVLGSFLGAMMTRGVEKEAADFYDQAVTEGKLLVAIEVHDNEGALARAERILATAGALPLPLAEG